MDESKEWKYIKERTDLLAEIKTLKETINRYEKALKEITEDIEHMESMSEMGFMDYYDGLRKTDIALDALKS
jgi:predicted phage-related endonuclease